MGDTSTGCCCWCSVTDVSGVVGAPVTAGENRLTLPCSWKWYAGHIWLASMLSAWIGCLGLHRLAAKLVVQHYEMLANPQSHLCQMTLTIITKHGCCSGLACQKIQVWLFLDTRWAAVMSVDPVASELTRLIAVLGRAAVMPAIKKKTRLLM